MTREEALRHWLDTAVADKRMELMLALHQEVLAHRDKLTGEWIESFKQLCADIRRMQDEKRKGKIKYIHYSILRSQILIGDHRCRIAAYDAQWHGDTSTCTAEYEAGWAFAKLDEFKRHLSETSKKYVGKLLPADVAVVVQRDIVWYTAYVIKLARYALREAVRTDEFAAIDKEDEQFIYVGEHQDRGELVYRYEARTKDVETLKEMFSDSNRSEYVYEVFRGANLSGMYFQLLNLSFGDFSESTLAGSLCLGCALIGADFHGANLQGADLSNNILHGASFREANLQSAKLEHIKAGMSFPSQDQLHIPPFMETSFAGANLEQASFRGAELRGADFRGAVLKGTSFADADLAGAMFRASDAKRLDLSAEQLAYIIIDGSDKA